MGHPYFDVIDNSTDFESKIRRVIEVVCKRIGKQLGADIDDRLKAQSKKRKFLVKSLPDSSVSEAMCWLTKIKDNQQPLERFELSTPGLQSATGRKFRGVFNFALFVGGYDDMKIIIRGRWLLAAKISK